MNAFDARASAKGILLLLGSPKLMGKLATGRGGEQ